MEFVTKCQVQAAVNHQLGEQAEISNFEVKEFTEKCDNYTTSVYFISVHVTNDGKQENKSMIVKVHPKIGMPETNDFYVRTFKKEGGFYLDLAPLLSTELSLIGHVGLRIPKPYYLYQENNQETLYLEDLREDGFRVSSRTIPFDVAHTILVLQEFARLHGSSMLLAKRSTKESLLSKFPFLENLCADEKIGDQMTRLFSGFIQGCIDCALKCDGYEAVGNKITKIMQNNLYQAIVKSMDSTPQFEAIIHFDCFSNNYLFRYNKPGVPVETRLIDFQLATIGSVMADISSTLHTSLSGNDRRKNLDCYLYTYYATLSTIFSSAGEPMPFTMKEMKQEYEKMKLFGLILGLFSSCVIMESDQVDDYDPQSGETVFEFHRRQVVYSFENNPVYKSRIMDLFNDFIQIAV